MLQSEEVTNYELEELHAGLNALTHRMDQVLCRSPKEWWAQCVIYNGVWWVFTFVLLLDMQPLSGRNGQENYELH